MKIKGSSGINVNPEVDALKLYMKLIKKLQWIQDRQ